MKTRVFVMCILIITCISMAAFGKMVSFTLQWDPNSEPDLAGYKIYVGTQPFTGAPADYTPIVPPGDGALATTYSGEIEAPDGAVTTIYARVTAYNEAGLESDFSNEVSKVINLKPPAPPQNLTWWEIIIGFIKELFGWS